MTGRFAFHVEHATERVMTLVANALRSRLLHKNALDRGFLSIAAALAITFQIPATNLGAQTQPFSSSAEYKSMVEELHEDPILPSRMASGTLLSTAQAPANLKVIESAARLGLETAGWRLAINKDRWAMALTNKQTGLTWHLGEPDNDWSGLTWMAGGAAEVRPAKVQSIVRQGDHWRMDVGVGALEIAVISPTVIRLSIRARQPEGGLRLNISGAGPFFGSGERFDRLKLDGAKLTLHPEDLLSMPGHNWTYMPTPFLFTPRGLGIYLDTASISSFDLSRSAQQQISIQLDHPSVDAYFFAGEPKGILEDYTSLTGRTPLTTALGIWSMGLLVTGRGSCAPRRPQAEARGNSGKRHMDVRRHGQRRHYGVAFLDVGLLSKFSGFHQSASRNGFQGPYLYSSLATGGAGPLQPE